jgi:uncharacterized protein (DUF1697 family)
MSERYVAFLRGINLGKRRATKEQLTAIFENLGFENVKTLIASGNVVFDVPQAGNSPTPAGSTLATTVQDALQAGLGFKVETMLRRMAEVDALIDSDPFTGIEVTKQTRLYVTLLAAKTTSTLNLPYEGDGGAIRLLSRTDREVFSVVVVTEGRGTVDAMGLIEKEYGKSVTTRNWNTILKLRGL